jgi:hypothetical protein
LSPLEIVAGALGLIFVGALLEIIARVFHLGGR